MPKTKSIVKAWPLHIFVLLVAAICAAIGTIKIPIGSASLVLMPMLFGLIIGMAAYLTKAFKPIDSRYDKIAEKILYISIPIIIAKLGCVAGASLNIVINAGPALLLQEFGNFGTIFVALPVALILGFKRESIGMSFSIAREPNVAIIAKKYGLNSAEGKGVMTVCIVGYFIGTIFMGILAMLMANTFLHPYALAMGCGVGSASMLLASSGSLIAMFPDMANEITAYSAASNALTNLDGVIFGMFIAIPLANKLYKILEPRIGRKKPVLAPSLQDDEILEAKPPKLSLDLVLEFTLITIICMFIILLCSTINVWAECRSLDSFDFIGTFLSCIPGCLILFGISWLSLFLNAVFPKIPDLIWGTIIGMALAVPFSPTSNFVVEATNPISIMVAAIPILTYAGVSMAKNWDSFKKIGWRGVLVTIMVMFGTFVGSALVAQVCLMAQGII